MSRTTDVWRHMAYLECIGVLVTQLVHLLHLFLAFLETPEVILNEEGRVELAHCDVIVSYEKQSNTKLEFFIHNCPTLCVIISRYGFYPDDLFLKSCQAKCFDPTVPFSVINAIIHDNGCTRVHVFIQQKWDRFTDLWTVGKFSCFPPHTEYQMPCFLYLNNYSIRINP